MIIGLDKKFIFLATLKTASSSIEDVLRHHAEITIAESRFCKHMTVRQLMENFGWIFVEVAVAEFFTFGVIRDPVDFALSVYNSHTAPQFGGNPALNTAGMNFQDFLDTWMPTNADQMIPQHLRFLDADDKIGANYIISFDQLNQGLAFVTDRLGIPELAALPKLNESPPALSRAALTQDQIDRLLAHFESDVTFINRHCNKLIESFKTPAYG